MFEPAVPHGGHEHSHDRGHIHAHPHGHGHSHGLVDRSIVRSREGVKAVALSLAILGLTAGAQLAIFLFSNSVALLADLIHNFGDALTAVPLGIAFILRSFRGEKLAGLAVVLLGPMASSPSESSRVRSSSPSVPRSGIPSSVSPSRS